MGNRIQCYLLVSSALGSAMLAAPAFAQSGPSATDSPAAATQADSAATPGSGQDIVVTGIRHSLDEARDIKRDSTQFVDAIVAEDIGKLPDRNVAESLARVSGVQVDRGIGEGTSVSIRGLRQNVFLLNGREIDDATAVFTAARIACPRALGNRFVPDPSGPPAVPPVSPRHRESTGTPSTTAG